METGISDHVWSIEEMWGLLPDVISAAKRIDKGLYPESPRERVS
jgi:hypothetical protein